MKPEFSKPFDMPSAKAGAPYCCRSGAEATVLKWDGRGRYPLKGVYDDSDQVASWLESGGFTMDIDGEADRDLVMLPLGLIDGKPVYVGDKYLSPFGQIFTAEPSQRHFKLCLLPVPVPEYPVTRMSGLDLRAFFADARQEMISPCIAVANAAIAQCFKDGDAVLPFEVARLVAEGIAAGRAERDLAVAQAVRDEARNNFTEAYASIHMSAAYGRISNIDLASIVASVSA